MNTIKAGRLAAVLSLFSAAVPCLLAAQASPLVLEVHGGASQPIASFAHGTEAGEGTAAGASLGVMLAFSGSSRRTVYAGFSQHRFACRDAGCPDSEQFVATGFDVGLRFNLRSRGLVVPWIRLGAVTSSVEHPAFANEAEGVSDLGLGGEVGLGLYIGGARPIALVPGVRVGAVNTALGGGTSLRMRYLAADVALAVAF